MSQPPEYVQGSLVQEKVTFRNFQTGLVIDPTTVRFRFEDPSGNKTVYTYPTDLQIVKVSTGIYYVWVDLDEPGKWFVRFEGTGMGQAAVQRFIDCLTARPSV